MAGINLLNQTETEFRLVHLMSAFVIILGEKNSHSLISIPELLYFKTTAIAAAEPSEENSPQNGNRFCDLG